MDALNLLNQWALSVESAHLAYQMGLRTLLGEFLDRRDAWTPKARGELATTLYSARLDAQRAIKHVLHEGLDAVAVQSEANVGGVIPDELNLELGAILAQGQQSAQAQIFDALRMDEDTVLGCFKKIQLGAAMRVARGKNPQVAFDLVKGGALAGISFTKVDRAGAAWSTAVYSRTVARWLYVTSYDEIFLLYLLADGGDVAAVRGDDGKQIKFSITGTLPDLPTYDAIRAEYLHPNASRLVERWTGQ